MMKWLISAVALALCAPVNAASFTAFTRQGSSVTFNYDTALAGRDFGTSGDNDYIINLFQASSIFIDGQRSGNDVGGRGIALNNSDGSQTLYFARAFSTFGRTGPGPIVETGIGFAYVLFDGRSLFDDMNIISELRPSAFRGGMFTYASNDGTINIRENFSLPEPGSWAMMIVGIGMAGGAIRRHRRPVRVLA